MLHWFESVGESIHHMRKVEGLQVNGLRRHSPWKKGRLFAYSAIPTTLVAIAAVIQSFGGIDNVRPAVLWLLVATAGIPGIFLLKDMAYQSIAKQDSLCIHCGESRTIQSFCVAGECPHCGK